MNQALIDIEFSRVSDFVLNVLPNDPNLVSAWKTKITK